MWGYFDVNWFWVCTKNWIFAFLSALTNPTCFNVGRIFCKKGCDSDGETWEECEITLHFLFNNFSYEWNVDKKKLFNQNLGFMNFIFLYFCINTSIIVAHFFSPFCVLNKLFQKFAKVVLSWLVENNNFLREKIYLWQLGKVFGVRLHFFNC